MVPFHRFPSRLIHNWIILKVEAASISTLQWSYGRVSTLWCLPCPFALLGGTADTLADRAPHPNDDSRSGVTFPLSFFLLLFSVIFSPKYFLLVIRSAEFFRLLLAPCCLDYGLLYWLNCTAVGFRWGLASFIHRRSTRQMLLESFNSCRW